MSTVSWVTENVSCSFSQKAIVTYVVDSWMAELLMSDKLVEPFFDIGNEWYTLKIMIYRQKLI